LKVFILIYNVKIKVTEEEVFSGLLDINDPNDTALVFFREFEEYEKIPKLIDNFKLVQSFIDLDDEKNVDKKSKQALDELKNRKVKMKIAPENIKHYLV
jgi:hypothetical protein